MTLLKAIERHYMPMHEPAKCKGPVYNVCFATTVHFEGLLVLFVI